MAYKDLIYQDENFVALENKEPIPTLWVTENFGIILSECNYRCVFNKYAEQVDTMSWSYDDMFYSPVTSIVFLVCYDVFNVSLYRPESGLASYYFDEEKGHVVCRITDNDGVCIYRDIEDCTLGYVDTIGTREEYMFEVLDVIRDDTGLDLSFLVKTSNLNCKVYPFLRVESLSRELEKNGLRPFSEDSYPIVYVSGTDGYNQYFRPELHYEPDDSLSVIGKCVADLIEDEALSMQENNIEEPDLDDTPEDSINRESVLDDMFSDDTVNNDESTMLENPDTEVEPTEVKYEEPYDGLSVDNSNVPCETPSEDLDVDGMSEKYDELLGGD